MWPTKQVEIGRVQARLSRKVDRLGLRLHLDNLLSSAAWQPPGVPPSAILVIRRLADPLPGQLALHWGTVRASAAWERAMQTAVAGLYQQAVRPDQGRVLAANADAVLFADSGEMLACLALDLSQGRAWEHWWWHQSLRKLPSASLETFLCQRAHHLPAMLFHLAEWGQAVQVVEALSLTQARSVVAGLAQAHSLANVDAGEPSRPTALTQVTEAVEVRETEPDAGQPERSNVPSKPEPRAPWAAWLPPGVVPRSLARERAFLLGLGLSLYHRPAVVRSRAFVEALRAWWNGVQTLPGEPAGLTEIATASPLSTDGKEQPPGVNEAATEIAGDEIGMDAAPRSAKLTDAAKAGAWAPQAEAGGLSGQESEAPAWGLDRQRLEPTELSDRKARSGGAPVGTASRQGKSNYANLVDLRADGREEVAKNSATDEALPAQQVGVVTELGGVLYLINLMQHLDLPNCFEETWELASQVGPWGILELLARGLLGKSGAYLQTDPLWAVLAGLDGREPRMLPGEGFVARGDIFLPAAWLDQVEADRDGVWLWASDDESANPLLVGLNPDLARWLTLVLPFIRYRLHLALGGTESEPLDLRQVLLLVRGRLYVTSSHVDLVLRLDDMSLPVRLAGLDFDPGWLPDFGRVVQFHFE